MNTFSSTPRAGELLLALRVVARALLAIWRWPWLMLVLALNAAHAFLLLAPPPSGRGRDYALAVLPVAFESWPLAGEDGITPPPPPSTLCSCLPAVACAVSLCREIQTSRGG